MLRFLTCGSVDDGKSTLIGRLLYDAKIVFDDQLKELEKDSKKYGTTGDNIDMALLIDGLKSEREQGITIDVAYRFFSTKKRKFIIADTPGHEQYTRNMVTGASNSDLAIVLVDARKGILAQTRRHSFILWLLGIKHIIVAINKIDLVEYSYEVFKNISSEYDKLADRFENKNIYYIPLSALNGDNVVDASEHTPWYTGKTLLELLDTIDISSESKKHSLRFPIQYVNRPNSEFRGYCGTIASGSIKVGDEITVMPSKISTKVKTIINARDVNEKRSIHLSKEAFSSMAITITTEDEVDISRGDMIVHSDNIPTISNSLKVILVWMDEKAIDMGSNYDIKIATTTLSGSFERIDYKIDIDSFEEIEVSSVGLNDIVSSTLLLNKKIALDLYDENKQTGSFIVIDKITNNTVAAGMVVGINHDKNNPTNQQNNLTWHKHNVTKQDRVKLKQQKSCILWFTGLSGSGKSSIANGVERALLELNKHTFLLDGDNIRMGLNSGLGFSDEDRMENIRRVGEVSKLFVDSGTIVLAALISPFQSARDKVRSLVEYGEFIEIFVDTPLEVCKKRDVKGLYKKAIDGQIENFVGITSVYERPKNAEIVLDTLKLDIDESVKKVIEYLKNKGYFDA